MKAFTFLFLLSIPAVRATHLLGGYIQTKATVGSALTYEVTVVLYMQAVNAATEQATAISICFGDGSGATATRVSQERLSFDAKSLYANVTVSRYRVNHSYAGPGVYTLTTALSNRASSATISGLTQQELLTLTTTFSTNAAGNQTPSLSIPATGFDVALNQKAVLSLKATDADGDSLVYGLTKILTSTATDGCTNRPVAMYQFPNDLTRQGTFKLNSRTGELIWDAPVREGYYSIALTIGEYRNGVLLSQTVQEIPLIVTDRPGIPSTLPAYEPAVEGVTSAIITATTPDNDTDLSLITFPNPVDDRLQLIIQTSNPTTATVQLLDVNGKKFHEQGLAKSARRHEQSIDMSELTPGVYLVRATVGGRSLLRKVVKR